MDDASEEGTIKHFEERKDFMGALKCALKLNTKSLFLHLKIGKYYRILGFPEKAIDTYICAAMTYPDRSNEVYRQIDACVRYIYQKYLAMHQINGARLYIDFPKISCAKLRARIVRGVVVVYCDGNMSFKDFLLKFVSGRLKRPNRLTLIMSNVTSVDLLNLSRFVKIAKSVPIQRVHVRGHLCHHALTLLLKGLSVDEIIFEDLKLSEISDSISIQVKNFSVIGQIHEGSLGRFHFLTFEHYVGPSALLDKMQISIGPRCHTLQGATLKVVESKQLNNLRSLSLTRSPGEYEFSLNQLNNLTCLGRLSLSGYSLKGNFSLRSLCHLELHRFTGLTSLVNILSHNMQIKSLVINESCESLKKSIAELICGMPNLKELIVVNCAVDLFFLEFLGSNFFKSTRMCLGLVNCGANTFMESLAERYPIKYIFHDNGPYELLRERSWPETQRNFYYKE